MYRSLDPSKNGVLEQISSKYTLQNNILDIFLQKLCFLLTCWALIKIVILYKKIFTPILIFDENLYFEKKIFLTKIFIFDKNFDLQPTFFIFWRKLWCYISYVVEFWFLNSIILTHLLTHFSKMYTGLTTLALGYICQTNKNKLVKMLRLFK